MNKTIRAALFATLILGLAGPAAAAGPGFAQVFDGVDENKNTKLAAKQFWKDVKGKEVNWGGVVRDVKGDETKAKIYVADNSRPLHDGYNIIVYTHDSQKAAKLKKGQQIRFKGMLDDFDGKKSGAILEVKEATIN